MILCLSYLWIDRYGLSINTLASIDKRNHRISNTKSYGPKSIRLNCTSSQSYQHDSFLLNFSRRWPTRTSFKIFPLDPKSDNYLWRIRVKAAAPKALMILFPILYLVMNRSPLPAAAGEQHFCRRLEWTSPQSRPSRYRKTWGDAREAGPALRPKLYLCQDLKDVRTGLDEVQQSSIRP